jgi:hypothetical protein
VRIPEDVETRLRAFIDALMRAHRDPRSDQFRELIGISLGPGEVPLSLLRNEYARSMRFLYRKEFEQGAESLYHDRGLSTDTQVEANYAVWGMLSALAAKPSARPLNRVLIVGPGLDLAPRTDLVDVYEPQSFQPFAVADALITLKLAERSALRIECIDVNAQVISFLRDFARRKQRLLHLFSGLADRPDRSLTAEFKGYFRSLLGGIGREEPPVVRPALGARLQKTVLIDQEIARQITASRLDVITERFEPSPGYDLVVATNVLQYFGDAELLLAIANIASMLGDGGFFLHNEARPELAAVTTRLGLPPTQSRTFLIAGTRANGLFDGAAIHQKIRTPDSSVGPHQ